MLPDDLLTEYANKFFGFGSWNVKIWFVGIEEAGGWVEEDLQRRLDVWQEHGCNSLEDAPRFYPASRNSAWHDPGADFQTTWKQLIRMLLLAKGQSDKDQGILEYQRNQLGAFDGETCLMELLPLPSPSTDDWNYGLWSRLPWLRSRNDYFRELKARRENEIRRRINEHKPKVVIFYGLEIPERISLLPGWSGIGGGHFHQAFNDKQTLLFRENERTAFFVTRHPAAENDEYFREIGRYFREHHGSRF